MGLPAITLSNASDPKEVWNMFWQCSRLINGNLNWKTGVNLGTPKDISPLSKNIQPSKIKWSCTTGHDHSSIDGSGPISWHGFRKNHVDLNSANIVWHDYFGNQWDQDAFLVYPGVVTKAVGASTSAEIALPTRSSSLAYAQHASVDLGGVSFIDPIILPKLVASEDVLAIIVSLDPILNTDLVQDTSVSVFDDGGTYKVELTKCKANTTYYVNFLMFVRCIQVV
jgi:hypothetical protein